MPTARRLFGVERTGRACSNSLKCPAKLEQVLERRPGIFGRAWPLEHDGSIGSSATSPAAVCMVVHLRRGRTEVQLQRPDQRACLASMQRRACSSVGRNGRLQACARLPQRRRLRAALEHRSRATVGELHHQLPQGFVRAVTATATAAADGTASSPAAHVVRAVPHGTHGA